MYSQKKINEIVKQGRAELTANPSKKRIYKTIGEKKFTLKIGKEKVSVVQRTKHNGKIFENVLCTLEDTSYEDIKKKIAEETIREAVLAKFPCLGQIFRDLLEHYKNNRSNTRYQTIKSIVNKHLTPFYDIPIDKVNVPMIVKIIESLDVSAYCKYNILCVVRLSMDYAVIHYPGLEVNPLNALKK